MSIAILTANFGNFDKPVEYALQTVEYDFYKFTDENFPPRHCSMTPRLQARLVKCFGWQMVPEHDYYIWMDQSYALLHSKSVSWLVQQCQGFDIVVFHHPRRFTIQKEADYLKHRLRKGCEYITARYKNELIDEQLAEIFADKSFEDTQLFQSSTLVYQNNPTVRAMFKEWWYHITRYHTVDQLALPYVLWKSGCKVNVILVPMNYNYLKVPYLTQTRYL